MNRKLLTLMLALVSMLGAGAQNSGTAVITATLDGVPDGTVMEALLAATHRDEKPIATATVSGGKAVLSVPVPTDEPRLIGVMPKGSYFMFTVLVRGGENVSVSLTAKPFDDGTNRGFQTSDVKVSGSSAHDEYVVRYVRKRERLDSLYAAYHAEYADVMQQLAKASANKDTKARDSIFNTLRGKAYADAEHGFFKAVGDTYATLISDNRQTWWGPMLMLNCYNYFTKENKKEWDKFSDAAKQSFYGKILDEQINPKGFVGQAVPQFTMQQSDGTPMALADAVSGSRYYLVDFWASWCGPCRREIPNLKNLYAAYRDKGLQIVSVSTDKDDKAWKKALGEEQLPWPNGVDRSEIANSYKIRFIPAIFLVDGATGKCIAENIRGEQLAQQLAQLFASE